VAGSPSDVVAVVLGAADFPYLAPSLSNTAFANSNKAFVDYLNSDAGFQLRGGDLLDLFASELSVFDLDDAITRFLQSKPLKRTVIIYYVGHGGFLYDQDYFLCVASTRSHKEYLTGYRLGDLAMTLRDVAANLDVILILDCCFAGEAVKEFMPLDIAEVVGRRTVAALQGASTALLVAASKDKAALTPKGNNFTMFTESLVAVLNTGIVSKAAKLTLQEVREAIEARIMETHGRQGVRPEVHTPRQIGKNIATIPLFPNPAVARATRNVRSKGGLGPVFDEIEKRYTGK
jgi:Caspase domain